ncbi:MAG TPA: hypothetical protein VFY83_01535, partial [Anaerolineales bacterium]|nr:hypothetical protein [Anaerolineales bacterium]
MNPPEKPEKKEFILTLNKRLLLVFLVCCIQMIYIPTSNQVSGGIEPRLPIDIFPIWPIWVLPYVFCYIFWVGSIVWVLTKVEDRHFRSLIAACILTFGLGAATFIIFPTYVRPADLQGSDLFTLLLRHFHEDLGRYAAF